MSDIYLFTYSLSILRSCLMHMHAPYVTCLTAMGLPVIITACHDVTFLRDKWKRRPREKSEPLTW